jgi:hypothetical protein
VRKLVVRWLKMAGGFGLVCAMMVAAPAVSGAGAVEDLAKAKENGRVAFVLVTEPGAAGVDEAERVIREAVKERGKAVLVLLDRSRPENASLVSKYRLAGPQVPIVLVFAANGVMAGGALTQGMTTEKVLAMVPTRREAELIEVLQSGRSALVLVSRSGLEGDGEAFAACEKARDLASGKLAVIRVDMTDKGEKSLLAKLRIDAASGKPVTVVINSRGQMAGAFEGAADPALLVQASTKVAGGGCCPGGAKAGAACAPPAKKLAASRP